MRAKNPSVPGSEINNVAIWALKIAALTYDPARGVKFISLAHPLIWHALIRFCRVESARGMHVPTDHEPFYASRPQSITAGWHHPRATYREAVNELGEDFWRSVARTLCSRERQVIIGVFRDRKTLKVIGPELGISKQRAGQLYAAALQKLRRRVDLKELVERSAAA